MALSDVLERIRGSRKFVVFIVFVALLLDNILLTIVVPIIPDYLLELEQADNDVTSLVYLDSVFWNETYLNTSNIPPLLFNITRLANNSHVTRAGFPIVPEQATIINENSEVGWLFSSKAIVQLVANPFIGSLTNRSGSHIPMFAGFVILTISALLYAFGESFAVLFLARSIQGLSSSCTGIAGLTMLADTYSDDKQRSRAMGVALGGISLGVLIGYPVGGLMYQFVGKMTPFLIIALLAILEGALQLWAFQPHLNTEKAVTGTPLNKLIRDPYILIASGAILFPEMAMAMLEPTLPIWLIDKMDPPKWQLGTVFLPDSIGYVIGTTIFGICAHKIPRWLSAGFSLILMGVCLACIPFATQIIHLVLPHFGLGLALGIVDLSIMPLMALLVDTRHVAVYGSVYAIAQVAISLGFALGPALGGEIVRQIGFPWLIRGMGIVNLLYVPFCYFLRDPPSREETKSILMKDQKKTEESFNYQRLNDD